MAKRQVFFSFHFDKDIWRVGQVRNIGAVDGQEIFFDNGWEKVRLKSDTAIKAWIDSEMRMRSCIVVLIGTDTASRRWVQYEIEQAWRLGKGVVGIYIHGLEDYWGRQASKGHNPFDDFYIDRQINYISHRSTPLDDNDVLMSAVCKAYDPPYVTSKVVYQDIKDNIEKLKIIIYALKDLSISNRSILLNRATREKLIYVYDNCKNKQEEYQDTSKEINNFFEYYYISLIKELEKAR